MDVDVALVSRMIYAGAVDKVTSADIKPGHFADQAMAAVYEMCAAHYRVFRESPSLDVVRSRFPDVQLRVVTDSIEFLISEFKEEAAIRAAVTKWQDWGRDIDKAQAGDREVRSRMVEISMEHTRDLANAVPTTKMSFLSDMHQRVATTRAQQESGVIIGVRPPHNQILPYVPTFKPSQFVVYCAVSGVGKTTGLVRGGISAFEGGERVLMVSLEMDEEEIWEMFDAHFASLSRKAMERRELSSDDYRRYEQAAARFDSARNNVAVVCPPGDVTIDNIASYVEQFNPGVVLVDYVSLLKPVLKRGDKWESVAEVSASLKQLARSYKVVVCAAAQNNRDAIDSGPTEGNIAHSLTIWQDCNIMIGYHQDAVMARMNKVQCRLIKNRRGDKGPPGDSGYFEFNEHWDRDRLVFEDWSEGKHEWAAKAGLGVVNGQG